METCPIDWRPGFRVISTRFPTVNIFDGIVDAEEFDLLFEIEAQTNPRLREQAGLLSAVDAQFRKYGPGFGPVMAPFTHINPVPSRFADGSFGVLYAAQDKATAIAETVFHQEKFLSATETPRIQVEMRLLTLPVTGDFVDLGHLPTNDPIYSPTDYAASNELARHLRAQGRVGVAYRSVRRPGGQCIAAFHPGPIGAANPAANLLYRWDGSRIVDVLESLPAA